MKAAYFEEHGGLEVMKFGDLPDPVAGPNEVLIDIHAASVNAADAKVRAGQYSQVGYFPYVLGRDLSGIVCSVGEGVDEFAVGEGVFGICDVGQEGTYAEKIVMKAALIAIKPNSYSHEELAAIGVAGLTAVITLEETLKLKSGEKILIQGGAGGVAGIAIQLAKYMGAHVVTTASLANHDYVQALGADEIIDYNVQDFTEVVSNCDAVFDTVGGEVTQRSFAVLKPGGRAAFIASGGTAPDSPRDDVESLRPKVGRDRPHLERILELLDAGAFTIPELTLFPLSDAVEAQRVSESRHLHGKLVLKIR